MGRTVGISCASVSVTDEFTESIDARLSVNVLPSLYFQMCHHAMYMGCSQKRCTKGGDRVRGCITHLLSIKNSNVDGFHVSVVINI